MKLTSSALQPDEPIDRRFTCDGANHKPPLSWTGAPASTRSFALVCSDPDAPRGTWYHWAVFDIPSSVDSLPEGNVTAGTEAVNDFGKRGYGGPCPPPGHGPHRYIFRLYALPMNSLRLSKNVRCREVEKTAAVQALATAELTGTYAR